MLARDDATSAACGLEKMLESSLNASQHLLLVERPADWRQVAAPARFGIQPGLYSFYSLFRALINGNDAQAFHALAQKRGAEVYAAALFGVGTDTLD
ncbi:MAG: hypothetical protein L0228_01560 [Planctomycetes bacterium]|nr:hypothetical protein [Planctomycetota bacterium]